MQRPLPHTLFFLLVVMLIGAVIPAGAQDDPVPQGCIVFAAWPADKSGPEIFTINADGSNLTQWTNSGDGVWNFLPRWSPDGTQVAYVTTGGVAPNELRVLDVTSDAIRNPMSKQNISPETPSWSPDGRVAVASDGSLFLVDVAHDEVVTLTPDEGSYIKPLWSPDGSLIAVEWVARKPTTTALLTPEGEVVATFELVDPALKGLVSEKAWSPDGSQLMVLWVDGTGTYGVHAFLELIDVASGSVTRLLSDGPYWIPMWTPDGSQIVYDLMVAAPGTGEFEIWLYDLDTGETRSFVDVDGISYRIATWSPDGEFFAAQMQPTDAPVKEELQILDTHGDVVQVLTAGMPVHFHWNPGIDWAAPLE